MISFIITVPPYFDPAKTAIRDTVFAWQLCNHILLGLRPMVLRPTLSSGLFFSGF
jgi:hypothetical protein